MVANLSLNTFEPNQPIDGLYVYMANEGQLHNVIVAPENTLVAGTVVALDATSTNTYAPVVKAAESTDEPFGVVSYTPIQAQHTAGQRVGLAREHDVIWKTISAAVAVGDKLAYDDTTNKVATATSGDVYIGTALTAGSADGDLVQVELKFGTLA